MIVKFVMSGIILQNFIEIILFYKEIYSTLCEKRPLPVVVAIKNNKKK